METEQELNIRHAAPTELWIGLALLTITTIIVLILLTNDGRTSQRRTEKKIAFIKTDFYGKKNIQQASRA